MPDKEYRMEDYRDSQTCKAKVGLLFLRDCGSIVKNNCSTCGRPVCKKHSIDSEKGVLCPECAAQAKNIPKSAALNSTRRRNDYYNGYGYSPYYYGYNRYYSDSDYRTFDESKEVYEEPPSGPSDRFDDSDDYMES